MTKSERTKLYTLRWLVRNGGEQGEMLAILDELLGPARTPEDEREGEGEVLLPSIEEPVLSDPFTETFRRSPNQGGAIVPKFIVIHSSYGTFAGDLTWILKDESDVSYHYLIDPETGNRVQFVHDTRRAWHAGVSYWKGYNNLNSHSIGISFTGPSSRRAAQHEIESVAWKCAYLMKKFPVIKVEDILTHQMIAPRRKDDTGRSNYQRTLTAVRRVLANS